MCKHRESTFSNHMNMYNPDHLMPLKPTSMLHETTQDATSKLWRVWDCSQVRENPSLHTSLVSFYFSDRAQLLFVFVAQIWVSFFFIFYSSSNRHVPDTKRLSYFCRRWYIYMSSHVFFCFKKKTKKYCQFIKRVLSNILYETYNGRQGTKMMEDSCANL